jgi:hypothetical protein
MERPRNYADPAKTTYIAAGPLTFGIEYRHLQNDQGICIHVFGDLDDNQENSYGLTILSERRITTMLGPPATSTWCWIRRLRATLYNGRLSVCHPQLGVRVLALTLRRFTPAFPNRPSRGCRPSNPLKLYPTPS